MFLHIIIKEVNFLSTALKSKYMPIGQLGREGFSGCCTIPVGQGRRLSVFNDITAARDVQTAQGQ